MKNIYYGDTINTQHEFEDKLELFSVYDKLSARVLNRPMRQSIDKINAIEKILSFAIKTISNKTEGKILPDYLEEFNVENIEVGSLISDNKKYIRIPTGAFGIGNGEFYFNCPKIELFERQLAEHFNFDLNDQDNDIKVNYVLNNGNLSYNTKIVQTRYNYQTNENNATITTNEIEEVELPEAGTVYTNMFSVVNDMFSKYGNYLTKKDDSFSLEETIKIETDWESGEYIIFFNKTMEAEDNAYFSLDNKFGIVSSDEFENLENTNSYIKLFKIYISIIKDNSGNFENVTIGLNGNSSYLEKLNISVADLIGNGSTYVLCGPLTCEELTSNLLTADNVGNVYEMSNSGTTSDLFINGAGLAINVGDNVGIIKTGTGTYMFNYMGNAFDLTDYQKKELTTSVLGETTVEGALGKIEAKDKRIWIGHKADWELLTTAEKIKYDEAHFDDDEGSGSLNIKNVVYEKTITGTTTPSGNISTGLNAIDRYYVVSMWAITNATGDDDQYTAVPYTDNNNVNRLIYAHCTLLNGSMYANKSVSVKVIYKRYDEAITE